MVDLEEMVKELVQPYQLPEYQTDMRRAGLIIPYVSTHARKELTHVHSDLGYIIPMVTAMGAASHPLGRRVS